MPKTDLAAIEAQLAEKAATLKQQIAPPQGRKVSIDRDGNLVLPGDYNLGPEAKFVVVDFCSANKYYPGAYDPQNVVPPVCFAFGDVIAEMRPEDEAPEPQSDLCKSCDHNQWGSSGRGKACKNTRELAVVLAEELDDPDNEPELYHLSVSPSSIKYFDAFVSKADALYNGHPIKAIVTVQVKPKANFFEVHFVAPEPNPHLARVFPLMEQAPDLIARTPDLTNYKPTRQQVRPAARR